MTIMRNQLLERNIGWLCGLGAAALFIAAIVVACPGCTPAERTTLVNDARWADSNLVLPLTEAVCEVETATNPPAGWVDLLCSFAEGIEARFAAPPPDAGPAVVNNFKAPASVRFRLTIPRAKQLAAAHPEVLSLPKGL